MDLRFEDYDEGERFSALQVTGLATVCKGSASLSSPRGQSMP
jgi:hypothetical protein